MDYNLEEVPGAREMADILANEDDKFDVHIYVNELPMVATAVGMSMSKRHNVEYYAHVSDFPGVEFLLGYLMSGYFKEIALNA